MSGKIAVPRLEIPVPVQVPVPMLTVAPTVEADPISFISDSEDEDFDEEVQRAIEEERKYEEKCQYRYRTPAGTHVPYTGKYYRLHRERMVYRRWQRRNQSQWVPKHAKQVSDEEYMKNIRECVPREEVVHSQRSGPLLQCYPMMIGGTLEEQYQHFCNYRQNQLGLLEEWQKGSQDPRERPYVPMEQTFAQFVKKHSY